MMFDNSAATTPSTSRKVGEHVVLTVLIGGAIAAAVGMHFASLTVLAAGIGHLLLGAVVLAIRSLRAKRNPQPAE